MKPDQKKPTQPVQIKTVKATLETLKRDQTIFSTAFRTMATGDRAKAIANILKGHRTLATFINESRKFELSTPAQRFEMENIKQRFQSLQNMWRKLEKILDEGNFARPAEVSGAPKNDEISRATRQYVEVASQMGANVDSEAASAFRAQLERAYSSAVSQNQGKGLDIKVENIDGKIKVKFEPK